MRALPQCRDVDLTGVDAMQVAAGTGEIKLVWYPTKAGLYVVVQASFWLMADQIARSWS